ncbi:hypothetical protein [Ulvibacter antarcticus]|uniref:Uncharacterized protein n=1 Tax=Ulvibacter antarcticus TaxID=442714 RepID=A0A3L9YKE9_9FLAO|nr:hypothetical protein [Ulvibacter antarcticus]RMA58595.1 hypothetical protein BXY75_1968 [Ulvibacter antarcticus]
MIKKFQEYLLAYIKALKAINTSESLTSFILKDSASIVTGFIEIADEALKASFENSNTSEAIEIYFINYQLPEEIKDLTILHRNVLLELQKTALLNKENEIDISTTERHFLASKEVLANASNQLVSFIDNELSKLSRDKNSVKKMSRNLKLHTNPWPVYKAQLEALLDQFIKIDNSKIKLFQTIPQLANLTEIVERVKIDNTLLYNTLEADCRYIKEALSSKSNPQALFTRIDDIMEQLDELGNNTEIFTEKLQDTIRDLEFCECFVSAKDGVLQRREISMSKAVQKWFDYKILPDLFDLMAHEKTVKAKIRITLINLKNSLLMSKSSEQFEEKDTFIRAVEKLETDLKLHKNTGTELSEQIYQKANNELKLTRFVNSEPFLEIPINTTITSSLTLSKNNIYKRLRKKSEKLISFFNTRYEQSVYLESFSEIEVTTKSIAHRMFKEDNEHYDVLFLNRNFIGDLFLVSRDLQEEKLKEAVTLWNSGFNKAVLIYGDRLSGRSTFLNNTAKNFFGNDIVNLKPNSLATIDGRKFTTTFNLAEALEYVKNNNSKSTRPAILIDDLELWCDSEYSLLENTRALISFVEKESDDAFVMATTTNAMKGHLDHRVDFSNVFNTLINVSEMDSDEIQAALLLRHGAAHRTLVTENGLTVSKKKIEKTIALLIRKHYHNIGEVLQSWTYNTFIQNGEEVLFKSKEHEFLDFFTQEELIILKQALLFKNISEVGLKRVTASGYDAHYKSAVRRLINSKVLLRDQKGNLSINQVVGQDVSRLLSKKMYLEN